MSQDKRTKRPGDLFLDRYMPDASEDEREEGRRNLYGFIAALYEIALRRARERKEGIRAGPMQPIDYGNGPAPPP